MKKSKLLTVISLVLALVVAMCACSSSKDMSPSGGDYYDGASYLQFAEVMGTPSALMVAADNNSYLDIVENPFYKTEDVATSQFSLDVNTAGYATLRRYINSNYSISPSMVKIEQMVNYFDYSLVDAPTDADIALGATIMDAPWNDGATKLATFNMRTKDVEFQSVKSNLVFLIDVSGSMTGDDRLGLIKSAFCLLVDNLTDNDRISIVTYASGVNTIINGASGADKVNIMHAIEDLQASGSTNGEGGIQLAYQLAAANFIEGGNNRVILATDGDFNVGISNNNQLENFIAEKRDTGVYLSVLGVGYGNLKDDKLSTLANKGNGNYGYLDNITEAKRLLVEEMSGTLVTVSKDTKAQIEFNPDVVEYYKLLGYENSLLSVDEWNDNTTDAGEIGAGHTCTAVYELVLKEDATYTADTTLATYRLRYKQPSDNADAELDYVLKAGALDGTPSEDERFIACVVEFAVILRDARYPAGAVSEDEVAYANYITLSDITTQLNALELTDPFKIEFKELVAKSATNTTR